MQNKIADKYDVVVVGAGPCGVTTASLLGKEGIRTLLIDKAPDILPIPRAIGICDEGSRVLDACDALDTAAKGFRINDKVIFTNGADELVSFSDVAYEINTYPAMRTFFQPELERVMRDQLGELGKVDFFASTEMIDFIDDRNQVQIRLEQNGATISTQCQYLLACDGASSPTRKALDIGFKGDTYPQDWLILDCYNNPIETNTIQFTMNPDRPGVTLPGPGDKRRWEFVVKEDDDRDYLMSEAGVAELVKPWCNMDKLKLERVAIYTFHARVADQYRKGNVFLVGDAAHITPPFAGQGMMAGLRDAYNIAWKVAGVINKSLNPKVLDSYEQERVPQSQQVIKFAQGMGSFILKQDEKSARNRDRVFKFLTMIGLNSKKTGGKLKRIKNHINGTYFKNLLKQKTSKTGVMLLQDTVFNARGEEVLTDRALGSKFFLLGWEQNPIDFLSADTKQLWESIKGHSASIGSQPDTATQGQWFRDAKGIFKPEFSGGKKVLVVRPDKMIVIKCKPKKLEKQLKKYLTEAGSVSGCLRGE